MTRRVLFLVTLTVLLAACSRPSTGPESGLCVYGPRPQGQIIGHVLPSGQSLNGDIDVDAWRENNDGVFSAIARPNNETYEREMRDTCFNEEGGYYYSCIRTVEIDYSEVRGIARATDFEAAERFALILCQRQTRLMLDMTEPGLGEDSRTYCSVSWREICPLDE